MTYRGRYFIRRRVWHVGGYAEVEYFPVFQPPGKRRAKCRPTKECQKLINERDAQRKLQRIILENFTEEDMEAELTYARAASSEEAVKDMGKFLRQLRMIYRAAGAELKYIYLWEQGKRSGRTHFHLILNAGPLGRDELEKLWGHGYANSRRLRLDETGLEGLAAYLTKRSRAGQREPGKRRWVPSRNLRRPEPEITDGAMPVGELMDLAQDIERRSAEGAAEELLPGMTLVEAAALRNSVNRGLYVYLSMAPPEAWHGRRPVARYYSGEIGGDDE